MRLDAVAPRTALFGTLAGWALCVWLLGLFGLGASLRRLPDDASLRQRLPAAVRVVPERLGAPGQYAEIGTRPLFSEDRRPQPFFINPEGEGEQKNAFDYILTSVIVTPRFGMAILQPSAGGDPVRVKVGAAPEEAPSWTLASVKPRAAVFNGPEGERTLELRVFDGNGGEPPTVLRGSNPNAAAAAGAQRGRLPQIVMPPSPPQKPVNTQPTPPQAQPAQVPAQAAPTDDQVEAIRQRIEARRAQLREEAQRQAAPPAQNP